MWTGQFVLLALPLLASATPLLNAHDDESNPAQDFENSWFEERQSGQTADCSTPVAVSPAPTGYTCGTVGKASNPGPILTTTAASNRLCAVKCLNDANCLSFSYGPSTKCITYSKAIVNAGFTRDATTKTAFYASKCFTRDCSCAPGRGDYSGITYSPCYGKCFDFTSDSSNCGACGVKCTGGKTCSGGKCSCPNGGIFCNGQCTDPNTDPLNCGRCKNSCPSSLGSGAYCYQKACKACPSDPEIVTNGGFETGQLDPWTYYTSDESRASVAIVDGTGGDNGSYYVQFTQTSSPYFDLSQTVNTCPGSSYLFKVSARTECSSPSCQCSFNYGITNNQYGDFAGYTALTENWQNFTYQVNVPQNGLQTQVADVYASGCYQLHMYVDAISVTRIVS